MLRTFATHAIDAARSAGAQYADVRVAEQVQLRLNADGGMIVNFRLTPQFMYGIRVLVDGAWAFVHGVTPSADRIVTAAHNAVATARVSSRVSPDRIELMSTPVVTGTWETPVRLDPFSVPLGDQAALLTACLEAAGQVRNGTLDATFEWKRETRVFASSEGSLVTQILRTSQSELTPGASIYGLSAITLPSLLTGMSGGYECVTRSTLQDETKRAAEEAAWYMSLPRRSLDVGRYPVVFDGATVGGSLNRTIGRALELDRVLGDDVGAGGVSYLAPPSEMLGSAIASPLLTVTANRNMPNVGAVKWDDEGVQPREFPLITQGQLANYITSRTTASELAALSGAHAGAPAPSTGCAIAQDADDAVLARVSHVAVAPSAKPASLEDLCHGITRGLLIRRGGYIAVDQKFASGVMLFAGAILEIENGKIVRRIQGNALQFTTSRLWRHSLAALGDATTVWTSATQYWKGQPETLGWASATAPAALFKDVDVIAKRI